MESFNFFHFLTNHILLKYDTVTVKLAIENLKKSEYEASNLI